MTNKSNKYSYFRTESSEPKADVCLSDEENDQFATIKRCPKDSNKSTVTTPNSNDVHTEDTKEAPLDIKHIEQITDQEFVDEYIYGLNSGYKARALYDYQAGNLLILFCVYSLFNNCSLYFVCA